MNIDEKMKQVPFGNSIFQIQNFIANQDTPERSYRHILLQLDAKMKAMKECSFRRRRKEIEIAEINEKLKTAEGFEKNKLLVDLDEAEYWQEHEEKLIEDCAVEIAAYEKILSTLPEYTREEFEKGERKYWTKRLLNQSNKEILTHGTMETGTALALEQLGLIVGKNKQGQLIIAEDKNNLKLQ
jgi:hypothetical protein